MVEMMNWLMLLVSIGSLVVIILIASAFLRKRKGAQSGGIPSFVGSIADVEVTGGVLKLTYYIRIFGVFKWTIGTVFIKPVFDAVHVEFQTRRAKGARNIALETVYSVGIEQQKRRPLLLILAIIAAIAAIVMFFTVIVIGVILLLLAGVLILLWYFQKKRTEFGILYGGAGTAGYAFLTRSSDCDMMIKSFLDNLMLSAQRLRIENAQNPAKYLT